MLFRSQAVRTAILNNLDTYKTNAVTYVNTNYPTINNSTVLTAISNRFDDIVNLLTYGIPNRNTPSYTSPSGSPQGISSARSLLLNPININFIQQEIAGFITVN